MSGLSRFKSWIKMDEMTKYSTDRNGITIGYGNLFSYNNSAGEMKHFSAILIFEPMFPNQINSLNYNLNSFATQMVWSEKTFLFPTTDLLMPSEKQSYVINSWFEEWLNENAPGWGTPPILADRGRESPKVFFSKVKQARAFRKLISDFLCGMPDVHKGTLGSKKLDIDK